MLWRISRQNSAWDFHPQAGLIFAGGYWGHGGYYEEVERSVDYGVSFQELAPLPSFTTESGRVYHGRRDACLTIVDENTVFVVGGQYGSDTELVSDELLKLDLAANEWTNMAPLDRPGRGLSRHSCFNREGEVFVVGGNYWGYYFSNVDAYNIATGVWRKSESFRRNYNCFIISYFLL